MIKNRATRERSFPIEGDCVFKQSAEPYRRFYVEFYATDYTYIQGYKAAAGILSDEVERSLAEEPGRPSEIADVLVYPIYFLYRQAIELALKQIRADRDLGTFENRRRNNHDLQRLWLEVRDWVREIVGASQQTHLNAFEKLIEEIHQIDPKGDAGRYDRDTNHIETFRGVKPIDLPNLHRTLDRMVNFLMWVEVKTQTR